MERRSSDSGNKVIKDMGRTTAKRITLAPWLVVFTLLGTAFAQDGKVVSTRIDTTPGGLHVQVIVDGQIYVTPVTLLWPAGSRHTLHVDRFIRLDDPTGNTHYQPTGFPTNRGACPDPCTLTADPDITEANVQVSVTYLVRVVFATCGSDSPGTVTAGGTSFT